MTSLRSSRFPSPPVRYVNKTVDDVWGLRVSFLWILIGNLSCSKCISSNTLIDPLLANRTFSLHGHEVVMRGAGSERRYTSKRAQWDFLAA